MEPITAYGHTYTPTVEDAKAWHEEPEKLVFCYEIFEGHIGADLDIDDLLLVRNSDDRVVNAIESAYEMLLDEMKV